MVLRGTEIEDSVDLSDSTLTQGLSADRVRIGRHLFLRNAKVYSVVLLGANIAGQFELIDAEVGSEVDLEFLRNTGAVMITDTTIPDRLDLSYSRLEEALDLSGSHLNVVDLTAASIRAELRLARGKTVKWGKNSELHLRSAIVGFFVDTEESWPATIVLEGCTYSGFSEPDLGESVLVRRQIGWFLSWVRRQRSFSPQAYIQLASVFERAGQQKEAVQVLFAGKAEANREATGLQWLFLSLERLLVGYGYRPHYAAYWFAAVTIIGALVFRRSKELQSAGIRYGIAYSADMLLPLIKLREWHYSLDLKGRVRYYLYTHKLFGYVLASFLLAALSGLTKL